MIRKIIISLIVAMMVIAFLLTYLFFDPTAYDFFPKCQFLLVSGYKCPGCGSQRAIHALLNGEILEAIRFNAIFVISIPIIGIYLFGEIFRSKFPLFWSTINSKKVIYTLLFMYIAWWILRNVFTW